MSNHVLHVDEKQLLEMEKHYGNKKIPAPPGALFRVKSNDVVITGYQSGKVLFQGKNVAKEMLKWDRTPMGRVQESKASYVPQSTDTLFHRAHIGSDEAGTGDYFGPITVAAVFLEEEKIAELKQLGVRDSKTLSDASIKRLAQEVIRLDIPYSSLVLHNGKYNDLQQAGWSQGKMKAVMHHYAIQHVLQKIKGKKTEGIIIDQFCEPAVYRRHLKSENLQIEENTHFLTKAESKSIAVAAASIIARTRFVDELDKLALKADVELPKGAGENVDRQIANLIRKHGEKALYLYGKVHFANTKKAYQYL